MSKVLLGIGFILVLGFLGLFVGTFVGSFFVPSGSGLAGPAIALGYGVMGLALAVVSGFFVTRKLNVAQLRSALIWSGSVAMVVGAWLAYRASVAQRQPGEQIASMRSPYQKPYQMHLQVTDIGQTEGTYDLTYKSINIVQDSARREITLTNAEDSSQECRGELRPLEAVDIAEALQRVAGMAASHTRICTRDTIAPVLYRLQWHLTAFGEALANGTLAITAACLAQEESLRDLLDLLVVGQRRVSDEMGCGANTSARNRYSSDLVLAGMVAAGKAADALAPTAVVAAQIAGDQPLGVGIVKPQLFLQQTLFFYNPSNLESLADHRTAIDSVTFVKGEHYVEIATAPPWFWPEVMKLDYDMLFLRAVTLSKNWIEVIVNRESGQTSWVDRHAVEFIAWPDFLLDIFAVEVVDPKSNPVRIKPLDYADLTANAPNVPWRPLAIRGSWMKVTAAEPTGNTAANGWIRWNDGERLLISYSPLN